jgi:hypothetical protein
MLFDEAANCWDFILSAISEYGKLIERYGPGIYAGKSLQCNSITNPILTGLGLCVKIVGYWSN